MKQVIELGAAVVEITPEVGTTLCGFGARGNKPSTGVYSPLKVRAISIKSAGKVNYLFNYDLIGIGPKLEVLICKTLEEKLGAKFSRERCVLTATHTHSGPPTIEFSGEAYDPTYGEFISQQTVKVAEAALQNIQPASLHTASVNIPGLTYNRRAILSDGRVSIVPEPDLPVVERGPLDDLLTLLLWKNTVGDNLAAIIHFPCHSVAVLTQEIGADIPGEVCGYIEKLFGAPCLYLQGAAGDINPLTLTAGYHELLGWMDRFIPHLDDLETKLHQVNLSPFCVSTIDFPLAFDQLPSAEESQRKMYNLEKISLGDTLSPEVQDTLPFIQELMHAKPGETLDPFISSYLAKTLADNERRTFETIKCGNPLQPQPLRISCWRLGEVALVFIAAEVFAITGYRIKNLRDGMTILPISYLSPLVGYLPDADSRDKGGYEVDYAWRFYDHVAPFAEDSEQHVVAAIDDLLDRV
jgi:hypothetical protein